MVYHRLLFSANMLLKSAIFGMVAASWVAAQETGPDNTTDPTVVDGEITIHYITVGKEENQFVPNSIIANPGDIVQFEFFPQNHSVIQSLYGWPCVPKGDVIPNEPYFYSDFFPTATTTHNPTWNLTINDTSPIFYYCGAPGSCIDWGMLGVINPDSETSLVTQLVMAKSEAYMVEPGASLPVSASTSLATAAAIATGLSTSASASTTATATASAAATRPSKSSSLAPGAIAGIAVGAVAVLASAITAFYVLGRKQSLRRAQSTKPPSTHLDAGHPAQFSPPPMYQQFSLTSHPVDGKDGTTTHFSPIMSPYSPYTPHGSYQDSVHTSPPQRSRFSETSELGTEAPDVRHELYAPLAAPFSDTLPYQNRAK